jgi:hypothetical protein
MQRAVNKIIEEEVFCMDAVGDHISGTEPNQNTWSPPVWRRGRIPPP